MTNENEPNAGSQPNGWKSVEENNSLAKRGKSNWEKREQKFKERLSAKDAEIARLRELAGEEEPEYEEEEEDDYRPQGRKATVDEDFDTTEFRLFRAENEEGREYSLEEYREIYQEYPWLSPEKILRLLKAEKPKSKSTTTLDLHGKPSSTPSEKKLEDMSEAEIQALPVQKRLEWKKAQKK